MASIVYETEISGGEPCWQFAGNSSQNRSAVFIRLECLIEIGFYKCTCQLQCCLFTASQTKNYILTSCTHSLVNSYFFRHQDKKNRVLTLSQITHLHVFLKLHRGDLQKYYSSSNLGSLHAYILDIYKKPVHCYKNIIFPVQAEYCYFSTDFRPKISSCRNVSIEHTASAVFVAFWLERKNFIRFS